VETVSFVHMEDGTKEDYELLDRYEREYVKGTAQRVIAQLDSLRGTLGGYRIDRLHHSLQTATRALRDGASEEMVVAALLHDIGDGIAPHNHGDYAASILKPYVSPDTHWIIQHHGIFQGYYFLHHLGQDRYLRDQYRDHPCFEACVNFCARWDQTSFDPNYDTLPLAHFEPMVSRVFEREPFDWGRKTPSATEN